MARVTAEWVGYGDLAEMSRAATSVVAAVAGTRQNHVVFLGPETPEASALYGGLTPTGIGPEGAAAARAPMALVELAAAVTSACV